MKRRRITHAEAERQFKGAERIAPGLWVDRHGSLHWSVPELLDLAGLPDTPEHREAITKLVLETAREHGITRMVQQTLIPDA